MAENLGPGVSRVLEPAATQYTEVILQQGKPPLDAEFNLLQELASNFSKRIVLRGSPSGFLGNETNPKGDFLTDATWSNWFKFGTQRTGESQSVMWAAVNGWLIPVTGTRTGTPPGSPNDADTFNVIALDPPPANSGDFRIDYVFLEAWQARIPPNPSTTNKPASSAIWRYGNVEGGYTFLPDDLVDPALGFETSQRVQLQYRIRVVKGLVGLTSAPDGFDPAVVKGQGAAAAPTSYVFTNMRQALGDPGLWRAGDGTANSLGTIDGYTYAVPLCSIFRRNSVVWTGDPSQNLNGGFNRNPTAVDRTGIKMFSTTPTLASDITASSATLTLVSSTNIPLPTTPATPVYIQIGDEIMTYASITGTTVSTVLRGQNGTRAEQHKAGSVIKVISSRPDGLFADQIAKTEILDLRHLVNPNGFDYTSLLKSNFDRLLKGQLRANWKRSGAGPQGPFVFYQDKITSPAGSVALGVTKIDGPDNIRMVFSDAAAIQPVECIVQPHPGTGSASASVGWGLALSATGVQSIASQFTPGDTITLPVAQLKNGLPGGDTDQVRWVNDGVATAVTIRVDGQTSPLDPTLYTVTPAFPSPNDNLVITINAGFPVGTGKRFYVTLHVMYGPGRGLARRPDSLHSVSYINPSVELLTQQSGVPLNNLGSRVSWAPLWSKFRNQAFKRQVPATSEVFGDLGSKTLVLSPFRRIVWPTSLNTMDGTAANPNSGPAKKTGTTGQTTVGSATFTDSSASFLAGTPVAVGDALVIASGVNTGRYTVVSAITGTTFVVDRSFLSTTTNISYTIHVAQGLMPIKAPDGVTSKWTTTDPLAMFSGSQENFTTTNFSATQNMYVNLPRHLMPGWGEVKTPVLWQDSATFAEGINFMCLSPKGGSPVDGDKNFVSYSSNGGVSSFATFSTLNLDTMTPITYNTAHGLAGDYAGMRFFTDSRGLGRKGLELPPFYGIARLFAVYEAADYKAAGSAYNPTTRQALGGGAVNLLRQNMTSQDGPVFWIEIDADGDSTFILNANALDLTKSPNAIASFDSGNYVVEASIFGFDRGSFDTTKEFRLVLARANSGGQARAQAGGGSRPGNLGIDISGPTSVLPGPATSTDQIVVNYSRTPYQGDAWGSQTNYIDIPYTPGSLTSGAAFQLASTELNEAALTRPNQKVVEVLASIGFVTTLGTGRLSGDTLVAPLDVRDVGYEDPTNYPPSSGIDPRPVSLTGAFVASDLTEIGTEYLGCIERLPLGALFRDKDFRGQTFSDVTASPLVVRDMTGPGPSSSLAVNSTQEQTEVTLDTSSAGVGAPGDAICHVDGEQGNYSLLVNFRVARGGSVFIANGTHPGGEVTSEQPTLTSPSGHTNVMQGRAYLVRNTVTNIGATEVSAGSELMLLVVTNVQQLKDTASHNGEIIIGTNGSGEGYAAAGLYRIEGNPITSDNIRLNIDPAMPLSRRAF